MPLKELKGLFPNLKATKETITSERDIDYNCAGWAINDKKGWWEPFGLILPTSRPAYKWPNNLPHNAELSTYIRFFEAYGFRQTDDGSVEPNVEKLALYARDGEFTHVARQLPSGRWTSKIGEQEDIQHTDPSELENDIPYGYGTVAVYLRKP